MTRNDGTMDYLLWILRDEPVDTPLLWCCWQRELTRQRVSRGDG